MSCDHELANEWVRCSGRNASYITIGQMVIAIALLGFNDLGGSVTSSFLFQEQILFTIISTMSKNEQKIQYGKLKKNELTISPIQPNIC